MNVSSEYREALNGQPKWAAKATVDLADGRRIELDGHDIMKGGIKIEDSTSEPDTFQLGSAIIQKLTLIINNRTQKLTEEDLTGAVIRPYVGLVIRGNYKGYQLEWLQKGIYVADDVVDGGSTITVTAYDYMSKFDKSYASCTLQYPATLYEILASACQDCGIPLSTLNFLNSDYTVDTRPDDDKTTYREIVSYVAQLAGCFAKIDHTGNLILRWYDLNAENPATIISREPIQAAKTPIKVTGVQIVPDDDNQPTYISGTAGYVVSIEGNPLAQAQLEQLAASLGEQLNGFTFQPLSCSGHGDPSIEAGDTVLFRDNRGASYTTFVSNLTYTFGQSEQYSCDAETPEQRSAQRYSAAAKAVQASKKETVHQISQYDIAVQQMNSLMANAMGLYQTVEKQDDGSIITYDHDKPLLSESQIIYRKTRDAYAWTDDGGNTWHGYTADGNILAKILTVVGVNADWINVGVIRSPSNPNVYLDLDQGIFAVNRLVSGNSDVWAEIGEASDDRGGQGFFIYKSDSLVGQLSITHKDSTAYPWYLWLLSRGGLVLQSNATDGSDAHNRIQMDKNVDGNGWFNFLRGRTDGTRISFLASTPDTTYLRAEYGTTVVYVSLNQELVIARENGDTYSVIRLKDGQIDFSVDGRLLGDFNSDGFNLNCNIDMNGWSIQNCANMVTK